MLDGESHKLATWGRHGLHPVAKRPKTATEKLKDHLADGGEEPSSGARGATPAILGMNKATNGQNGGGDIEAERRAWKDKGEEHWKAYKNQARKLGISERDIHESIPPTEWSGSMYERDAPKYPHVDSAHKLQAELSVRRKDNLQNLSKADEDPPRKPIKDMTGDEMVEAHKQGKIRINRSYRPGQPQHPDYAKKQKKVDKKEPTEPPWWVYMKGGGHTGASKRGAYYARDIQKLEGKQTKARVVDSAGADIHGLPYVR